MSARSHRLSVVVDERDSRGIATKWLAACGRHAQFVGATYEEVEDKWRQHVYEEKGVAPKPMGKQDGRWSA